MSYILDALRKSDQQRQRGAAPTLPAAPALAAVPARPAFLAYGLLAAALLGAGMLIGWLRPWQSEPAAPAKPEPVAARPLESSPRQAARVPSQVAPRAKPEPQAQSAPPPVPAAAALVPAQPRAPARAAAKNGGAPPEAGAVASSRVPAPEQPAGKAVADAGRVQPVISMAELPLALQQELPAMTISVHAYSGNPGDRMVGINSRMMREGEYVVPGLKLEQITPDGMIFGYKGFSFRRGVK